MRLENTYKGRFLATYIIKSVLVSLVLLGSGLYGLPFMEGIYRVEETKRLTQREWIHLLILMRLIDR